MRALFLHNNFPAQFRHIASLLAKNPKHQIVFATKNTDINLPNIRQVFFSEIREVSPETHRYVRPLEEAVLNGQGVFRLAEQLKATGFVPDIIVGHSGWGPTLFLKDAFPDSPLMCYFEWFYHSQGADAGFDPNDPLNLDDIARIRMKNAPILLDLYSCDWGLSPTYWQHCQFPDEFKPKISVLHDGVDTNFFKPNPEAKNKLVLPDLDLSHVDELVTYVSRGMEPYRGFPQFIESLPAVLERKPNAHVVIVASERVCYGRKLPEGVTYKDIMLKKVPLDLSRVHFVGSLPYHLYLRVIQASSVHVYLTRPFVLSWSMIESLATGCLLVASDTPPVTEVVQDGYNGLLVDFFSASEIADRIVEALDNQEKYAQIRANARQTVLDRYSHELLLPKHLQLIDDVANRRFPPQI